MKNNKKLVPALVVLFLIIVIILMMLLGKLIEKYTPTKEVEDLSKYYNLTQSDQTAIVLNNAVMEDQAVLKDGKVYLKFSTVQKLLNSRFYWDSNENLLLYTTPTDVVTASVGAKEYYVSKDKKAVDYAIWYTDSQNAYVAADYIKLYTDMDFTYVGDPNRILITTVWDTVKNVPVKRDTQLRVKGGIKSPILKQLKSDDTLTLLESGDNWDKVCSQDGIIGYVQVKRLGKVTETKPDHSYAAPEFTHNLKEGKINMGFHQVTSQAANSSVASVISNTKGMNVIVPTWFYLNDNNGNLMDLSNADYVNYCHQNGIEVWALVSNLENPDVDSAQVLNYTSKRTTMVNQLIAAAIQGDFDGINVDFEALSNDAGQGYIQFIRELGLKCKNNGIRLSVDNYVPTDYTAFYNRKEQSNFADYVVVMGYDEHYSGSEKEGSVASIGFVTQGITDTLKEVPAQQTILAMPFYTRVWAETPKDDTGDSAESAAADYVPYTLSSQAVGMQEAFRMAKANGVEPVWQDDVGQYYAEYVNAGVTYKIWLEDAKSLELKLQTLQQNGLAGGAFWKLGFEDSTLWDTIIKYLGN